MKLQELKQLQSLSLEKKIEYSKDKIRQFYEFFDGNVYVSFSGGKDSTVLLYLVRSLYPEVEAVFIDTGLEYPEIREFVKTIDNVKWIRSEKSFIQVIREEGYPVISKEQVQYIREYKETISEYTKKIRWNGNNGKISKKWCFLIKAPFKVSEKCCNVLKKNPAKKYEKATNTHPYIGTMATDSYIRQYIILRWGCNNFRGREKSQPLSIWTEEDIWKYIEKFSIPYCSIYNHVKRTGCIFCMFGIQKDKCLRFKILRQLHPNLYKYCMNTLGLKEVLKYINDRVDIGYNDLISSQEKIIKFI